MATFILDFAYPRSGEVHGVKDGLILCGGPTSAGTAAELLRDKVWCGGVSAYAEMGGSPRCGDAANNQRGIEKDSRICGRDAAKQAVRGYVDHCPVERQAGYGYSCNLTRFGSGFGLASFRQGAAYVVQ